MSASLGVYRLQQVDSQIARAQAQLDAILKTLENDAELREALSRVEAAKKDHHQAHHELKAAEMNVLNQQIKIQQAEASLYGGSIQNPKELQDLQNDITSLKKYLVTLEERELEAMAKVETVDAVLQKANKDLESLQSRLGDQHKKLLGEQTALLKDLERLSEEREAAIAPIESRLLETYENLRRQKRGIAVAEINDNSCAACGSTLTAAMQQSARSSSLITHCPTCGRILYAG